MPDGADTLQAAATAPHALLQLWLSPAFPVGAFAYSHGLERAAEQRWITDRATLSAWLADLVAVGALHNDLILLAAAWRAASRADRAALNEIAHFAAALQPSAERHLETTQQGRAFLAQIAASWPCAAATDLLAADAGPIAYPVAVGVATASHAVPLPATLLAFALAFVSNLVSAAIRLSVIGHTDGQRVIAGLLPSLEAAARAAEASTLDDLGAAAFRSDIASLAHETQYTRLFRS